jgi:hypothetical protein
MVMCSTNLNFLTAKEFVYEGLRLEVTWKYPIRPLPKLPPPPRNLDDVCEYVLKMRG